MRQLVAALILLVLSLPGCVAVAPPQYGNFTTNPASFDEKLAADAVAKMVALYPPAKTRLELRQPTPDSFGVALVKGLREQGYALKDYVPPPTWMEKVSGEDKSPSTSVSVPGLALQYVVDQAPDSRYYRLTINVGTQSIARRYVVANGTMMPAGYWVHKE